MLGSNRDCEEKVCSVWPSTTMIPDPHHPQPWSHRSKYHQPSSHHSHCEEKVCSVWPSPHSPTTIPPIPNQTSWSTDMPQRIQSPPNFRSSRTKSLWKRWFSYIKAAFKNGRHHLKTGWLKLWEQANSVCQKVSTRTKILSPNIRCFVAILRFVAAYAKTTFFVAILVIHPKTTLFVANEQKRAQRKNWRHFAESLPTSATLP